MHQFQQQQQEFKIRCSQPFHQEEIANYLCIRQECKLSPICCNLCIEEHKNHLKENFIQLNQVTCMEFLNQIEIYNELYLLNNSDKDNSQKINQLLQEIDPQLLEKPQIKLINEVYLCIKSKNQLEIPHNQDDYTQALNQKFEILTNFIKSSLTNLLEEQTFQKGQESYKDNKYNEALYWLDRTLEIVQNNKNALNIKSATLLMLQKYEESLEYANRTLKIDPYIQLALYSKSKSLQMLKRYKESIVFADKALAIQLDKDTFQIKAESFRMLKKYKESIVQADKALLIDPTYKDALQTKAESLQMLKRYKESIIYADKVLKIDPNFQQAINTKSASLEALDKGNQQWNGLAFRSFRAFAYYFLFFLIIKVVHTLVIQLNRPLIFSQIQKVNIYYEELEYADQILAIKPNSLAALTLKSDILLIFGQYYESLKYADKILNIDERDTNGLLLKAQSLLKMKDFEEAIEYANKIQIQDPSVELALLIKSLALHELNRDDESIQYANQVLTLNPDNLRAQTIKAGIYDQIEIFEFLVPLGNLIKKYSHIQELHFIAAFLLNQVKEYEAAIQGANAALILDQNYLSALYEKTVSLIQLRRYQEALESAEKMLAIKENYSEALVLKGDILRHLERYDESIEILNLVQELDSDYIQSYMSKALSLKQIGKYQDCEEQIQLVLNKIKNHQSQNYKLSIQIGQSCRESKIQLIQSLLKKANTLYFDESKYEESLIFIDKILEIDPNSAQIHFFKGLVLYSLHQYDNSIQSTNTALGIDGKFIRALELKAKLLFQFNKFNELFQIIQIILSTQPLQINVLIELSEKLLFNNTIFDNIKGAEIYLVKTPQDLQSQLIKANSLKKNGAFIEALKIVDQVLMIQPTHKQALIEKNIILLLIFADSLRMDNQNEKSLQCLNLLLNYDPNLEPALSLKGGTLFNLRRIEEAKQYIDKALLINPNSKLSQDIKFKIQQLNN